MVEEKKHRLWINFQHVESETWHPIGSNRQKEKGYKTYVGPQL